MCNLQTPTAWRHRTMMEMLRLVEVMAPWLYRSRKPLSGRFSTLMVWQLPREFTRACHACIFGYFHDACLFDAPQTYILHVLAHVDVLYVCGLCPHTGLRMETIRSLPWRHETRPRHSERFVSISCNTLQWHAVVTGPEGTRHQSRGGGQSHFEQRGHHQDHSRVWCVSGMLMSSQTPLHRSHIFDAYACM